MVNYVTAVIDPELVVSPFNGDPSEIDDPVVHGDAAGCLTDDSDATYVEVPATDEVFSSGVSGTLLPRPVTKDVDAGPIKARIRVKGPSNCRVSVSTPGVEGDGSFSSGALGTIPTSPTWVEFTLTENTPAFTQRPMVALLNYLNNDTAVTHVLTVHTSGGPENARLYVYEAQLLVPGPSSGAPPSRLFPRSDGLGVGSGRYYPPAKSQQRGNRRAGGYY